MSRGTPITIQEHGRKLGLRFSSISDFAACPKLYEYRHVHRVSTGEYTSSLAVGGAMHAATEVIRRELAGMAPLDIDRVEQRAIGAGLSVIDKREVFSLALAPALAENTTRQAETDRWKLRAMVRGYVHAYLRGGLPEPVIPVGTASNEVRMEGVPLLNPATGYASATFSLEGTADGLLPCEEVTETGEVLPSHLVYEQKTTGATVDEVIEYLRHGVQVPLYQVMARHHLAQRDGCASITGAVLDVVKKPTLRQKQSAKTAESIEEYSERCVQAYREEPERYFRRVLLDYDERMVRQAQESVWSVARQIRECLRHGFPALRGPQCQGGYGWCRYKALCWHDITDGYIFGAPEEPGI